MDRLRQRCQYVAWRLARDDNHASNGRRPMASKRVVWRLAAMAMSILAFASASAQNSKPSDLKIGITTFVSGAASVFGVPAKAAAELWISEFNAAGGIDGVKLTPVFIDEGLGGEKMLTEYRRVVQDQGVQVMLASISRGSCNTVAPVAEDLK